MQTLSFYLWLFTSKGVTVITVLIQTLCLWVLPPLVYSQASQMHAAWGWNQVTYTDNEEYFYIYKLLDCSLNISGQSNYLIFASVYPKSVQNSFGSLCPLPHHQYQSLATHCNQKPSVAYASRCLRRVFQTRNYMLCVMKSIQTSTVLLEVDTSFICPKTQECLFMVCTY